MSGEAAFLLGLDVVLPGLRTHADLPCRQRLAAARGRQSRGAGNELQGISAIDVTHAGTYDRYGDVWGRQRQGPRANDPGACSCFLLR